MYKSSKIYLMAFSFLLGMTTLKAQSLSLSECYKQAQKNYPLIVQRNLIDLSGDYSVSNILKDKLPRLSINGQASEQSAVTKLPFSIPSIHLPSMNHDQYKFYADISQPLTDLYTVNKQADLERSTVKVSEQHLEVQLYEIRSKVEDLYFGILLLDEKIRQNALMQSDLDTTISATRAAVKGGISYQSDLDKLEAESILLGQSKVRLFYQRKAYREILSRFLGFTIKDSTVFRVPDMIMETLDVKRPELVLYDLEKDNYQKQKNVLSTKVLPKFSLFLQSGVGRPGLNMLDNDFRLYYLGGLRLSWSLSEFYTHKKEKEILSIKQHVTDVDRETFLFNLQNDINTSRSNQESFREIIRTDSTIVHLRQQVMGTSLKRFCAGVITVTDYLSDFYAYCEARQDASVHVLQYLQAQYQEATLRGNKYNE